MGMWHLSLSYALFLQIAKSACEHVNYSPIMEILEGVLAALFAPLLMTIGFFIWESVWIGSAFALNLTKCSMASVGFLFLSLITRSSNSSAPPLDPSRFASDFIGWLILSSIIGILIGDLCWLEALGTIGARRVILVDALNPFLAAVFAHFILKDERAIDLIGYAGMVVTVVSVVIVSLEMSTDNEKETLMTDENAADVEMVALDVTASASPPISQPSSPPPRMTRGYILAFINVLFDVYGSVLTKQHGKQFNTWEINLIRFGFASAVMMLVAGLMHFRSRFTQHAKDQVEWFKIPNLDKPSWTKMFLGIFFVTFLCAGMRNYALFQIPLAVALTLGCVGPIYSLGLAIFYKKERISGKVAFFTILGCAGVVMLMFSSSAI